jgi:hypothetical protein
MLSCNPVKKVLKDNEKFEQVAQEVVRRGYCVNDTTKVTTIKDTTYIYTTINSDTIFVGTECEFDTVLASGTWIRVEEGYLMISEVIKERTRKVIERVDNYIRDTKYEDILKMDIETRENEISHQKGVIETHMVNIQKLEKELRHQKLYFISLVVLIIAAAAFSLIKYIKVI